MSVDGCEQFISLISFAYDARLCFLKTGFQINQKLFLRGQLVFFQERKDTVNFKGNPPRITDI
jgi:hypothetical protein